jgi:hypothetical protein
MDAGIETSVFTFSRDAWSSEPRFLARRVETSQQNSPLTTPDHTVPINLH